MNWRLPALLLTIFALAAPVLAQTSDARFTPSRSLWGEVLGQPPAMLELQLLAGGRAIATLQATMTTGGQGTYYSVSCPGPDLQAWRDATGSLSIGFVADGVASPSPRDIPSSSDLPYRLDVKDGGPLEQDIQLLASRAVLSVGASSRVTFTAVLIHRGDTAARGSLLWNSFPDRSHLFTAPMNLSPRGVTVSRITTSFGDDTSLPRIWQVQWVPETPAYPLQIGRVLLRDHSGAVTDLEGSGALPRRPGLPGATAPGLSAATLELAPGEWLELEMTTSLTSKSAVRTALTSWELSASGSPSEPARLALQDLFVAGLPDGGSWVRAGWLISSPLRFEGIQLSGPEGASLAGEWRLMSLTRFFEHEEAETY